MRKPGEPIYLRIHMAALALAVVAAVALPRLYEVFFGPISFGVRLLSGIGIAIVAGVVLHLTYQSSARSGP